MTESTEVAREMPERIWIDELPRGYVVHTDEWQEHDFDATEYVRVDTVEQLRAELSFLTGATQMFFEAYAEYWHNTAGQSSPSAMHDYELILEDALIDAGRTLDKFRERKADDAA